MASISAALAKLTVRSARAHAKVEPGGLFTAAMPERMSQRRSEAAKP